MFKKTTLAGLVLVAALASGPAFASPHDDGFNSTRVSYGDLDLSQSRDAQKLVERIRHAAWKVCETTGGGALDWQSNSFRKCVRTASAKAVAELNNTMVTAVYEGRSPVEVAAK
jgi:UrcA family protein